MGAFVKQMQKVLFQFTPLREGRRFSGRTRRIPSHFNSRPSARGDFVGCQAFER